MTIQQALLMFGGSTSIIKSVQYLTITIGPSSNSNTGTISSVDTSRTAILFCGMNGDDSATNYDQDQAEITLTNSTTVTISRNQAGAATLNVRVGVIEFQPSAVSSVQRGQISLVAGVTTNTATITSVDTNRSACFFGGIKTDNANGNLATNCATVVLTNGTTVTATRNTGTGGMFANYTVVEFASGILSSNAQKGTVNLTNVTSNTATITSVDTTRSILLWGGYRGTSNSSAPRFMPAITLTNGTTVTGSRQVASTDTSDVAFTVLEFAPGLIKSINRGVLTIATSSLSQTATVTAVDTSKCLLSWLGCNNSQADTSYRDNYSMATLTNSTTVTVTRGAADAGSTEFVGYELVEFT